MYRSATKRNEKKELANTELSVSKRVENALHIVQSMTRFAGTLFVNTKLLRSLHFLPTAVGFRPLTAVSSFYRAMHYSAKRGIAIACRPSVCPSVRLSACL